MYKIKDYSYKQAKKYNVLIFPSKRKNKKIDIFTTNGDYLASIGHIMYKDYPTYLQEEGRQIAEDHRRRYKLRHQKDRKNIGSPGFFADVILW